MVNLAAPPFRFGVVVLAAGASTRMGQPKQLLPVEGQPLLVRAAEAALESAAWPVIVVVGANHELIRPVLARLPVLIAHNPDWSEGMASSIRRGVETLRQFSRATDALVVALCDQPAFSAATIRQLCERQQHTRAAIVAAQYSGRRGAPALFLRSQFSALAALHGENGARPLLAGPEVATVDLPELAQDLDTPEEYAAFTQR